MRECQECGDQITIAKDKPWGPGRCQDCLERSARKRFDIPGPA